MSYYVHPLGVCESTKVGAGTKIWAFAHVLPQATIGTDCNICDHTFIENDVVIEDRVTVKCGVQIWDGIRIESEVFIGPNVTFTNDPAPRSKKYPEKFLATFIRKGASIGANATILPGIEIGENAMIGAGSVVTRSVPRNAIVVGNPAKITGYADSFRHESTNSKARPQPGSQDYTSIVKGVSLHPIKTVSDMRGDLCVQEFEKEIPFKPLRYFMVFNVPSLEVRGEHAHKECHQYLVCIKGSCSVLVDDGVNKEEFKLTPGNFGLYLKPMVWGIQYKYSQDAILMVFASHHYSSEDYIREYGIFLESVSAQK